ncbi:hypothetical protein JB92DRAFT_2829019 [Gautieria morchelliformis]|nr:hypothetical protein JB92DRAFT_2829019 [Gautieria morchelliformis]
MNSWLVKVQVSLIPIVLSRISGIDPLADDLAYETLSTLIRAPLAVQGMEMEMDIIRLIARELAQPKCMFQYSWLGIWLLHIVDESLRVRPFSTDVIQAIREVAARRELEDTEYNGKDLWRPWEVALFAQCAAQDKSFKAIIRGPHGLPSLIVALDSMLMHKGRVRGVGVDWENMALTLRALAFLAEQEWVAQAVNRVIHGSTPPRPCTNSSQEDAMAAFATLTNPVIVHQFSANSQLDSSTCTRKTHVDSWSTGDLKW